MYNSSSYIPDRKRGMRESKLFSGLTGNEYIQLLAGIFVNEVFLKPGQFLVHEGEVLDKIWFMHKGKAAAVRRFNGGGSDTVRTYSRHDIIGIDLAHTRMSTSPLDIVCTADAQLSGIPYNFADSPDVPAGIREKLLRNTIAILADENIRKQTRLDAMHEHAMRDRINIFLDYKRKKLGSDIFELKMNREELAEYLGVNRSALSKELSKMQSEGLINYRKHHFEILNPEALRDRQ